MINKKYLYNLMASNAISTIGDSIYYLALIAMATGFSDYSFKIVLVTISELFPYIFSFVFGILADKFYNKQRIMIICDLIRFSLYSSIALVLLGTSLTNVVFYFIILCNFFSDCLGNLKSILYINTIQELSLEEEVGRFIAYNTSINRTLTIIFHFFGAFVILILDYSSFAFLNALTFICSSILLIPVNKFLHKKSQDIFLRDKKEKEKKKDKIKRINYLKFKYPGILRIVLLFSLLNIIIFPMQTYIIISFKGLSIFGLPDSVINAIVLTIISISTILGASIFRKIIFKISFQKLIIFEILGTLCFYISNNRSPILMLISLALVSILEGGISPKLISKIVNIVPRDEVGTEIGKVNTILSAVSPIPLLILSAFSLKSGVFFILVDVVVLFFVLIKKDQSKFANN